MVAPKQSFKMRLYLRLWTSRSKRRAVQQRMGQLDTSMKNVKHTVQTEAELSELAYHLQGNTEFYADAVLTQRANIRFAPSVQDCLDVWWICARRMGAANRALIEIVGAHGVFADDSRSLAHLAENAKAKHVHDPLKKTDPRKLERKRTVEARLLKSKSSKEVVHHGSSEGEHAAAVKIQSAFRRMSSRRLVKESYVAISLKLYRAMMEEYDEEDALATAEEEWGTDSDGKDSIGRAAFQAAIFEMADSWTSGVSVEEYVEFLWLLLWRVCKSNDNDRVRSGSLRGVNAGLAWKGDGDIKCESFDIEYDDKADGLHHKEHCHFDADKPVDKGALTKAGSGGDGKSGGGKGDGGKGGKDGKGGGGDKGGGRKGGSGKDKNGRGKGDHQAGGNGGNKGGGAPDTDEGANGGGKGRRRFGVLSRVGQKIGSSLRRATARRVAPDGGDGVWRAGMAPDGTYLEHMNDGYDQSAGGHRGGPWRAGDAGQWPTGACDSSGYDEARNTSGSGHFKTGVPIEGKHASGSLGPGDHPTAASTPSPPRGAARAGGGSHSPEHGSVVVAPRTAATSTKETPATPVAAQTRAATTVQKVERGRSTRASARGSNSSRAGGGAAPSTPWAAHMSGGQPQVSSHTVDLMSQSGLGGNVRVGTLQPMKKR